MGMENKFYFILEDRNLLKRVSFEEWKEWKMYGTDYERLNHVNWTRMKDGAAISTVFAGTDHPRPIGETPWVFETMIIKGHENFRTGKYPSWELAEAGHEATIKQYQAGEFKGRV